jgi:hypothetical protein
MKELFEDNDDIRQLLNKEGLMKPSSDFTFRVMQQIEEDKNFNPVLYKPLLSRRAWVMITASALCIVYICLEIVAGNSSDTMVFSDLLHEVYLMRKHLGQSFNFTSNMVQIVTLAMMSMGILLTFDLWFSQKTKKTA